MNANEPAVAWLLASRDPSVRYFTLIELLELPRDAPEVVAARARIPKGPRVRALLAGQRAAKRAASDSLATHKGGFGVHPYKKWDGAHWRLVSLVELGIGAEADATPSARRPNGASLQETIAGKRVRRAAEQVLAWLTGETHRSRIRTIDGRTRRCASQEGNALAVCSRLGLACDARVQYLARSLVEWQWPDGGWNCDRKPGAAHSSFYESLAPLWGLIEYLRVTGDRASLHAVERAAEFFLRHRLFRSETTGEVINPEWLKLHYPLYWHYDVLQALVILSRLDALGDARTCEAVDIVESKRQADGCWRAEGYYWQRLGRRTSNVDVADWGRRGPNEFITLNALRVLKAAGRMG